MIIKDILPNKAISEYIRFFRIVHMVPTREVFQFSKYYIPKPEMVLHAITKGIQKNQPNYKALHCVYLQMLFVGSADHTNYFY
jgi:hypothetical protein